MKKITVRVKHFFDGVYMYIGLLLAMMGVIFLLFDIIVACIFFACSLLVFSTVYRLEIVKDAGYYRNYLWLLGIKRGHKTSFKSIDGILLDKHKHEHHISKRQPDAVLKYMLFRAYIIFDGKKVLVCETKNQSKIEKKVSKLKKQLNVEVIDSVALS